MPRGVASSKQARRPQHNMLTSYISWPSMNQDVEATLKQDKSEGAIASQGITVDNLPNPRADWSMVKH